MFINVHEEFKDTTSVFFYKTFLESVTVLKKRLVLSYRGSICVQERC